MAVGNSAGVPAYNKDMLIEGVFAAITTPFYPDERVYLRKLEANIARYSRSLLAGMVVLGSTGEAVTLMTRKRGMYCGLQQKRQRLKRC